MRWRRIGGTAALVLLLGFGTASALRVVGAESLTAAAGERGVPLAFDDYALQFYYGQLGARFLEERGATWGWDPSFMAGYPKTPFYYPSSKPFELALWLQPGDPALAFNRTVFLLLALLPLLVAGAAWGFGLSRGAMLVAVGLASVPHALVPMVFFYGIMEAAGMVPYIFASFLSLLVVALVHRFLESGDRVAAALLFAAAPLLYLCHLTAILISGLPIALLYLVHFRRAPWSRHLVMWALALVIVLVNWPWIEGYLAFRHYADLGEFYTPEGSAHFAPKGGLWAPLQVPLARPVLLSLAPPVLAAVGLFGWWREGRTRLLAVFTPQLVLLFVVSFYGVHLGLEAVAPGRILLPLTLYLLVPAGHGAMLLTGWIGGVLAARVPAPWRAVAGAALAVGLVGVLLATGLTGALWRPYALPRLEQREGFREHGMALLDWIETNTDARGRLLVEETDRDSHVFYGAHLAAWIPYYTGRELAGGPAPHPLIRHNTLRFVAGTFQGEPIGRVDAERLAAAFSRYNVRFVLVWKPATNRRLRRLPWTVRIGRFDDRFTLYRVEQEPSWFVRGRGEVSVEGGRLRLRELEPDEGVVTLKYHWLESLRADPPHPVLPQLEAGDPVPFISLRDPPAELEIFDDPDYGWP